MSAKGERYSAKGDFDEMESIGEKLAADLKKSIRHLDHYPILSDPWIEMAEIFGRLARISDVESALPASKKDATLWETEEQALRFLLEEGKLNLCLRILIEFKTRQIESRKEGRGPMIDYSAVCDKFEKGLGGIMRNAWNHVEVQQTSDLPALIGYIADVLEAICSTPDSAATYLSGSDLYQRQEVLVFYYLNGILKHIEDIRESRVMPQIRDRRIFVQGMAALTKLSGNLQKSHVFKGAEALALLVDTEDFATHRAMYYNADDIDSMMEFKERVLGDLMSEVEHRKVIRPLADSIDKAKRLTRK